MSYLNKDERREVILQAAMRVALEDGFSAMTVRRIATEAKVATGQSTTILPPPENSNRRPLFVLFVLCWMRNGSRKMPPGARVCTPLWAVTTADSNLI